MPRLVVTGCGRSGTVYMCRVLRGQGLNVQHHAMGVDGTVNWQAAVRLEKFKGKDWIIIHQVRYPLHAIGSLTTIKPESWALIEKHTTIPATGSLLCRAAVHWLTWNSMVEHPERPVRQVERCADWLPELLSMFGLSLNKKALAKVSKTTNTRRERYTPITWDDLDAADSEICARVRDRARKYGYES